MSFASAWWNDVTSAVYAWSNAQPGDLAYNANNWWFWDPKTTQSQCDWSQTDVDLLYQTLGWTSPLGTVGFQIGSGIPGNMNQKPYARPYVIWKVTLDVSGTVVYTNDLHDGTLVWQDVIDELYNNQGFDGTGVKPDVTGLDADQIQILLGANNTWPQLWIGFVAGVCNKVLSQTCLPRVGGPYLSCPACQDDTDCDCGGCAAP